MGHPEDNSGLLLIADDIRQYEFAKGQTSRDGEVATLTQQRDAYMAERDAVQAEFDAHMATHEPEPEPVMIGASFKQGENLPSPVTSIDVMRYFFQPGDFTRAQSWGGQANLVKAHDQYGARAFAISVKPDSSSGTPFGSASLTNIRNFFQSIPDDVLEEDVMITFYHEHDGNIRDGSLSIARYREGSRQLANIAHEFGFKYGPIHNAMVYDEFTTPRWGLYANIWSANEADLELYDFWGVDCYSPNYENPSPRMDPIKTYADSLGLPVLIGELGSPNGSEQAAWCAKARTWALENTKWAMYWSSQVSSATTNYRLTDAAAREWFGLV